MTDKEAESFRAYLKKGGFVIFDDFRGYDWENLQEQMRRVLPEARWVETRRHARDLSSFFEIANPMSLRTSLWRRCRRSYWGIFEDNDPSKRLMAIANVNNDISEYWELSDTGYRAGRPNNEAYKYGINYVMYGMTH